MFEAALRILRVELGAIYLIISKLANQLKGYYTGTYRAQLTAFFKLQLM